MIENKFNKKTIVPVRKLVTLLLIISFTLVFFIESAFAGVCFCGRCLSQNFQSKIELKIKSTSYKNSSDSSSKTCNFKNIKSLKGIYFSKRAPNVKTFSTSIISDSRDYSLIHQSQISLRPFPYRGILYASPVFLKNLSIRC